jgi:hypothetical protein
LIYRRSWDAIERRAAIRREAERRGRYGQWGILPEDEEHDKATQILVERELPVFRKELDQVVAQYKASHDV